MMPTAAHAAGDVDAAARAAKIKSAFVLNFIRYTTWPITDKPTDIEQPIRVIMIGSDKVMTAAMKITLRDVAVGGRRIELTETVIPLLAETASQDALTAYLEARDQLQNQMRSSQLIYICNDQKSHLEEILEMIAGSAAMTVSDIPGFAVEGGMLGLALRDNRVSFDANPEALTQANIKVSAKVLRLARIVKPRKGGKR